MNPVAPPVRTWTDPLEARLALYLRTGDEGAIEAVVAETRPRLLAAARRIGAPQDAEDAVQTAYLSLVRHRGAPLDAPVLPWLLTAVVRNAYRRKAVQRREDRLAERLARPHAPEEGVAAGEAAAAAEDAALLRSAVVRLPDRYRDPAVLHLLEGLSIAEVGRLLDLPEPTVRTRLHRARLLVRSRVAPKVVAGLLALPWFLADLGRDAGPSGMALTVGGGAKLGAVGLAVALVLAVGIGAGYLAAGPSTRRGAAAEERAAREHALEAEIAALRRDVLAIAAKRGEASLAAAAPRPAEAPRPVESPLPAAPSPEPSKPGPARAKGAPHVVFDGSGLEEWKVDWSDVGTRLHGMVPLVAEFARKWGSSKDPGLPDLVGKISSMNGRLVEYALEADAHVHAESGVNGAFVHPWFMVNAVAATLEAAGKPLTAAQLDAVRRAADDSLADEARGKAALGEGAYALERLLVESAARTAFFDATLAALDAGQRAVLRPEGSDRRLQGDLFSAAVLWTGHASGSLRFRDVEGLSAAIHRVLGTSAWPEARRVAAERAVADWLGAWPTVVADAPGDPMSLQGFLPLAAIEEAARRQVALAKRLVESGAVDAAKAAALKASSVASVPVYAGPPR